MAWSIFCGVTIVQASRVLAPVTTLTPTNVGEGTTISDPGMLTMFMATLWKVVFSAFDSALYTGTRRPAIRADRRGTGGVGVTVAG